MKPKYTKMNPIRKAEKNGQLRVGVRDRADVLKIWGLTGGIASGKSTVARIFEEKGIPIIDADQIARELSQNGGAAHASIIARFGTDQRLKLGEVIDDNIRVLEVIYVGSREDAPY